jgi:hypothetical protein
VRLADDISEKFIALESLAKVEGSVPGIITRSARRTEVFVDNSPISSNLTGSCCFLVLRPLYFEGVEVVLNASSSSDTAAKVAPELSGSLPTNATETH